jgi:hypothetical protein
VVATARLHSVAVGCSMLYNGGIAVHGTGGAELGALDAYDLTMPAAATVHNIEVRARIPSNTAVVNTSASTSAPSKPADGAASDHVAAASTAIRVFAAVGSVDAVIKPSLIRTVAVTTSSLQVPRHPAVGTLTPSTTAPLPATAPTAVDVAEQAFAMYTLQNSTCIPLHFRQASNLYLVALKL